MFVLELVPPPPRAVAVEPPVLLRLSGGDSRLALVLRMPATLPRGPLDSPPSLSSPLPLPELELELELASSSSKGDGAPMPLLLCALKLALPEPAGAGEGEPEAGPAEDEEGAVVGVEAPAEEDDEAPSDGAAVSKRRRISATWEVTYLRRRSWWCSARENASTTLQHESQHQQASRTHELSATHSRRHCTARYPPAQRRLRHVAAPADQQLAELLREVLTGGRGGGHGGGRGG